MGLLPAPQPHQGATASEVTTLKLNADFVCFPHVIPPLEISLARRRSPAWRAHSSMLEQDPLSFRISKADRRRRRVTDGKGPMVNERRLKILCRRAYDKVVSFGYRQGDVLCPLEKHS